ncbi:uncharacterized protein LOC126778309 isoform X2 [Nymphalis io]|uniref:uncharacterized protein LOC126778309 isoform X2 n=1 Tax=Inachis io TaxID=171585 RepID=UPI0021695CB8|nr:uncharacterized protein LOC126778309 isoform X2 [Nymphalis io]
MFLNIKTSLYVGCCFGLLFICFTVNATKTESTMFDLEKIDFMNTTNFTDRYTIPTTKTTTIRARTMIPRITFEENCDYLAYYCLKAYTTGKLCGRTLYYTYHTFKNYCLLDYVNCMERYEVYPYDDDYFLDQYYVIEDH